LPITSDVQYQVGTGDTLDTIAALFDVDLFCLVETNRDVLTDGETIFPGDVLLISADCPVYLGVGTVPFRRNLEQGGGGGTYTVRYGDTLDEIAFSFDVAVESLIEFNEIENPQAILPGLVLQIPPTAPPYGQVPARPGAALVAEQGGGEGITYVIQPGDTIDQIGAFFNISADCIVEANNIEDTRRIQPRDLLFIPAACPPYDDSGLISGAIIPVDEEITGTVIATVQLVTVTPTEGGPQPSPTPEILDVTEEVTATELVVPTITPTLSVTATATTVPTLAVDDVTEEATTETTEEATEEANPDSEAVTVAAPVIGATATQIPTLAATATATVTVEVDAPVTTAEAAGDVATSPTPEILSGETTTEGSDFLQGLIDQAGDVLSGEDEQ
ncbi:MAG: LysM domain-containing protein, partial [Chloroflexota bacterium]